MNLYMLKYEAEVLYLSIGVFFAISALITIHTEDNIYTFNEKMSLIFSLIGFVLIMVFQIKERWTFGVIINLILISLLLYRILNCYQLI